MKVYTERGLEVCLMEGQAFCIMPGSEITGIKALCFEDWHMDIQAIRRLADALCFFPNLTHLSLRHTEIGNVGVGALATKLQHLPYLTHIDLCGNFIDIGGFTALVAAFYQVPNLTYLDLSCNCIHLNGEYGVMAALAQVTKMAHLDLSDNNICYESLRVFIDLMWKFRELVYLDLCNNHLHPRGVWKLVHAIEKGPPTLKYLGIYKGNNVKNLNKEELAAALLIRPDLKHDVEP